MSGHCHRSVSCPDFFRHQAGKIFFAGAELGGEHEQLLATGPGIFTRSGVSLSGEIGYRRVSRLVNPAHAANAPGSATVGAAIIGSPTCPSALQT